MTRTTVFSWEEKEVAWLIRNNFLWPLCKRLWRHHVWREAKLWTSWRRRRDVLTTSDFLCCLQQRVRGSGIVYKACVTYWTAESRMRWLVCLGKDVPELQKRHWLSWGDGGGAGLWQNCDKWVSYKTGAGALGTHEGLQLWSLRSTRIDTRWLSRTNLIQITLWTCDCFYQIRYSTWCELVPASLTLLKDRQ